MLWQKFILWDGSQIIYINYICGLNWQPVSGRMASLQPTSMEVDKHQGAFYLIFLFANGKFLP